ncbi:stabilizer of axonemal microtubules 3-like [Corticium candelabrum]|uniref:stabilizer of axonemal microtubules 3-like n=1 Tax=Corticium candelabrum TaxID=121492 RepID=UPI002E26B574|nr:stabilizer of axonemal microtubules 3-like [Corticium candelabrum]
MAETNAGVHVDTVRMQARSLVEPMRNDLYLTSTGRGHEVRPTSDFPPPDHKTTRTKPLPNYLDIESNVCVDDMYRTTTGTFHDYKPHVTMLQQPLHKKAPGSWKVHYNYEFQEKLNEKPWRAPLTMSEQHSEAKDQYRGMTTIPAIHDQPAFSRGLQPPTLKDQHVSGTTKEIIASAENAAMKGEPFVIRDQGTLHLGEPYVSTTNKDHRAFSKWELSQYPKKDVATYWQCEDYPKAWGHGTKSNPLPKESVPREKGPMRDETFMTTATSIPPLPKQPDRVPHRGIEPLYKESFDWPSDDKVRELFLCPVPKPFEQTAVRDSQPLAPNMYQTFNSEYGSRPQYTTTST